VLFLQVFVLTFGVVEHAWVAVGFSVRSTDWVILSSALRDALFALSSV